MTSSLSHVLTYSFSRHCRCLQSTQLVFAEADTHMTDMHQVTVINTQDEFWNASAMEQTLPSAGMHTP